MVIEIFDIDLKLYCRLIKFLFKMEEQQVNGQHENGVEAIVTHANLAEPPHVAKTISFPTAKLSTINFTPFMKEAVDKVAQSNGFQNYIVNIDHGSGVGDGFVGLVFKVTIHESDSEKKLTVVLKSPPDNLARRNEFGAMGLFKREIYMYNEVLPSFVAFQEEKGIKKSQGFFEFPLCYYAEYNEEKDDAVIIMEDLRESGYKMWDKFIPHNFEHAKFLFASLGRLHAISFAMKTQRPQVFEKYKTLNDLLTEKFFDESFAAMSESSIERAAGTIDESDVRRRNRVLKMKENFSQLMKEAVSGTNAEPYAVVTHGDCWSNNFMYHYRRGSPQKICLLDWQISRYCSPVLDLVYFMFTCTDEAMRNKHYDELLNIYHRSLKDLLDHLGGDTQTQFPFTALLRQLKQFGKFGVLMASFLIPMITTKNDELPDMDYMAENMNSQDPEMMAGIMKSFGANNDNYAIRMRGSLLDSIRYGYL